MGGVIGSIFGSGQSDFQPSRASGTVSPFGSANPTNAIDEQNRRNDELRRMQLEQYSNMASLGGAGKAAAGAQDLTNLGLDVRDNISKLQDFSRGQMSLGQAGVGASQMGNIGAEVGANAGNLMNMGATNATLAGAGQTANRMAQAGAGQTAGSSFLYGQGANAANILAGVASGEGPNPAQLQYQQNLQNAVKQQAAAVGSIRGINPALAARLASQQGSQMTQGAALQSQQNLAAQQLAAAQAAGQLSAQMGASMGQLGLGAQQAGGAQQQGIASLQQQQQQALAQSYLASKGLQGQMVGQGAELAAQVGSLQNAQQQAANNAYLQGVGLQGQLTAQGTQFNQNLGAMATGQFNNMQNLNMQQQALQQQAIQAWNAQRIQESLGMQGMLGQQSMMNAQNQMNAQMGLLGGVGSALGFFAEGGEVKSKNEAELAAQALMHAKFGSCYSDATENYADGGIAGYAEGGIVHKIGSKAEEFAKGLAASIDPIVPDLPVAYIRSKLHGTSVDEEIASMEAARDAAGPSPEEIALKRSVVGGPAYSAEQRLDAEKEIAMKAGAMGMAGPKVPGKAIGKIALKKAAQEMPKIEHIPQAPEAKVMPKARTYASVPEPAPKIGPSELKTAEEFVQANWTPEEIEFARKMEAARTAKPKEVSPAEMEAAVQSELKKWSPYSKKLASKLRYERPLEAQRTEEIMSRYGVGQEEAARYLATLPKELPLGTEMPAPAQAKPWYKDIPPLAEDQYVASGPAAPAPSPAHMQQLEMQRLMSLRNRAIGEATPIGKYRPPSTQVSGRVEGSPLEQAAPPKALTAERVLAPEPKPSVIIPEYKSASPAPAVELKPEITPAARLNELQNWNIKKQLEIENAVNFVAKQKGSKYADQMFRAEHEILRNSPEYQELQSLKKQMAAPLAKAPELEEPSSTMSRLAAPAQASVPSGWKMIDRSVDPEGFANVKSNYLKNYQNIGVEGQNIALVSPSGNVQWYKTPAEAARYANWLEEMANKEGMKHGGKVPGKAMKPGVDDIANDTVDAKLTPGEIVIPLSKAKDPDAAAAFARHVAEQAKKKRSK